MKNNVHKSTVDNKFTRVPHLLRTDDTRVRSLKTVRPAGET